MAFLAVITNFLAQIPWLGQIVSLGINWWAKRQQEKTDAINAENQALSDHQGDGAISVNDRDSIEKQDQALDKIQKELENPTSVGSTKEGVKP
jgi:hypothetical protein